jgi:hypothetical protein
MCRIFLCDKPNLIPANLLHHTFENLIADAGGHGIGIGFYINEQPVVIKETSMSVERAVAIVSKLSIPVMVHFRAASAGTRVRDELCHPFITKDGLFCQNGGIRDLNGLGLSSDTHIMTALINHRSFQAVSKFFHSFGVLALLKPNGEFEINLPKNNAYEEAVRPWHELEYKIGKEKVWVGISNPDAMNPEIKIVRESADNVNVNLVCGASKELIQFFTGTEAEWMPNESLGLVSTDAETAAAYGLIPLVKLAGNQDLGLEFADGDLYDDSEYEEEEEEEEEEENEHGNSKTELIIKMN